MENSICKAHSGMEKQITKLEDEVRSLWKKWDKAVMIQFTILGGVILNLFVLFMAHFILK